jgi:glycosyltransferase involved in cell wall biosynthesis
MELEFAREVVGVPQPSRYTPTKIARGLFGRWPLPVENYLSPDMTAALTAQLRQGDFDIVHFDGVHMAGHQPLVAKLAPQARVVYDWHNVESEAMQRFADNATSTGRRVYAGWTARRLRALELHMLNSAFGHLVCSEREARQLRELAPEARVEAIDNGVDCEAFEDLAPAEPTRLVFVGSMGYHANVDAAVEFARNVWPGIRQRYPRLRLTLVGSEPAQAVVELGGLDGVEVTGTVPDVRPFYAEAVAAVVPLRVGGGTRLKILEAMAAGVPVISTELGAEGLDVEPGTHLLVAANGDDWVTSIGRLEDDPAFRSAMAQAARDLARRRYDWEAIGKRLLGTYCRWMETAG